MQLDGLKTDEMKKSFDVASNIHNIFSSGQGAGKSGSFFFFSADNKYIIKTLRGKEKKVLLDMLDDYIEYLEFK